MQDSQVYPLLVPLQLPSRYVPLAQLVLEHFAHWRSVVPAPPVHPPVAYCPPGHERQARHWKPFDVPEHEPIRYLLVPQLVLEQALQTRSDVPLPPVHPLSWYLPVPHEAAQGSQE